MTESPLHLLLEFDARSQRDQDQPPAFLHRRDRKFALSCEQRGEIPDARLWLEHMARLSGPGNHPSIADTTGRLWSRINAGFATAGVLLGMLTMLGLLFYDGGQRINITVFLAFVVLQLFLALFTTAQALVGWQPWRWLAHRIIPRGRTGMVSRLNPVLMARAAHFGGLGFALTGLLTLLVMVVVQDLAFGWSTTLETSAPGYHRLVVAIATPWGWLWPAAVPELALVEATRFFRADIGAGAIEPQRWGQWWPFVTMLWTTWVLLPRGLLTLVSVALVRRRARQLLADHPGMHALMYRMETPSLDTGSQHNDAADMPDTGTRTNVQPLPDSDILLCWAGAGEPELPRTLTGATTRMLQAGGAASLEDDQKALNQIEEWLRQGPDQAVLVVTRSWEPPTGELQDFLTAARELWPRGTRVALVPLGLDARKEPEAHQLRQWLRFADRVGEDFVGVSVPSLEWRPPYADQGDLV
ncbi:DUF2868 domain-containing protein [Marinobacter sp. M216]|uniref:DUF2868 domain-containing protein n=1 Tax=Marinobacter albus TaxID=3030833 RepID=A0ABT7HDG1_9GAMM|nr:DUF2868 domain-containing protein [Marinobacter sp. M216]MDK9558399.1 DUF2868 domain-containing protein [Marinobacter sp. M216]